MRGDSSVRGEAVTLGFPLIVSMQPEVVFFALLTLRAKEREGGRERDKPLFVCIIYIYYISPTTKRAELNAV